MWPFSSHQNDKHTTPTTAGPAPTTSRSPPPHSTPPHTLSTVPNFLEALAQPNLPLQLYGHSHERLGIPVTSRLPFLAIGSFITGFGLGVTTGGRKRADRFRAENSHRFPKTQAGWYLYHRSKSYNTIVGGVSEGTRFGGQLMIWAGVFGVVEEVMDRSRAKIFAREEEDRRDGQRDFVNTVVAGMSTVGCYIVWERMDIYAAGKMARMALKWSLAYGLVQDGMSCLKGDQPGYVQWLMRRIGGLRKEADGKTQVV